MLYIVHVAMALHKPRDHMPLNISILLDSMKCNLRRMYSLDIRVSFSSDFHNA